VQILSTLEHALLLCLLVIDQDCGSIHGQLAVVFNEGAQVVVGRHKVLKCFLQVIVCHFHSCRQHSFMPKLMILRVLALVIIAPYALENWPTLLNLFNLSILAYQSVRISSFHCLSNELK